MDLQAFVAVAQIVSALAVTLTLIAVIVSLRQNTRSQKALTSFVIQNLLSAGPFAQLARRRNPSGGRRVALRNARIL